MDVCEYMGSPGASYETFIKEKYFRKKRPNTIHFELTNRCNLRCIHCLFLGKVDDELSTEEICRILLQLKDIGVFYLALSGGEIFVRKDIEEILDFLSEHKFLLTIYTNGTLLKKSSIEKIAALSPQSVEISVYGATSGVHDAITQVPGSFERTIGSIKALREAGVRTIFKGFLLKDNFHERWDMIELAKKIDVPHAFDFNLIPRVNGDISNLETGLTLDQLKTVYQEVAQEGLILRNHVNIKGRDQLPVGGRVICNAGLINGCIGPAGEVFPCPILRLHMGNLREKDFNEIWATDEINAIRYMKIEDLKECFVCPAIKYCNRCPGVAYLETGNFLGPAPVSVCKKYKALLADKGE